MLYSFVFIYVIYFRTYLSYLWTFTRALTRVLDIGSLDAGLDNGPLYGEFMINADTPVVNQLGGWGNRLIVLVLES